MASTNYNSAKSNTAGKAVGPATGARMPGLQADPIPGVDVSIEQSPGGIIIATTQTTTAGTYAFTGLAPGTYLLRSGSHQERVTLGPADGGRLTGTVRATGIASARGAPANRA